MWRVRYLLIWTLSSRQKQQIYPLWKKLSILLYISISIAIANVLAWPCMFMLVQITLQHRHFREHDYLIEIRRTNGENKWNAVSTNGFVSRWLKVCTIIMLHKNGMYEYAIAAAVWTILNSNLCEENDVSSTFIVTPNSQNPTWLLYAYRPMNSHNVNWFQYIFHSNVFCGSCLVILTDISIKYQVRIWALWYFPRFDKTSVCSDQNSKHFSFDIFILCETIQSFDISGLFRENKLSNAPGLNVFVYWMHTGVYTLISPTCILLST